MKHFLWSCNGQWVCHIIIVSEAEACLVLPLIRLRSIMTGKPWSSSTVVTILWVGIGLLLFVDKSTGSVCTG